jgi:hypothetical protein
MIIPDRWSGRIEARPSRCSGGALYDFVWLMAGLGALTYPRRWLRAMLEGAGPALRSFILTGWIGALRLRLGPRSSTDHILGWKILSATPTKIVIGVEGSMLSAHQVVQCQDAKVVHVTIVHFDRAGAQTAWAVAAPIHVRTIPHLMNRARPMNSPPP